MPCGIPIDIRHIFPTKIFAYLIIGVFSLVKYNVMVIGIFSFTPTTEICASTPVTLRPLGLPEEIFYCIAGRAAVRIEGPLVGPTMAPVQLGVGIPFGCQIGAKGAQCAFDARKVVSTWEGNSTFNTEPRLRSHPSPSTVLCMGLWTLNVPAVVARSAGGMECNQCETRRSSWPTLLRRRHITPLLFNP